MGAWLVVVCTISRAALAVAPSASNDAELTEIDFAQSAGASSAYIKATRALLRQADVDKEYSRCCESAKERTVAF